MCMCVWQEVGGDTRLSASAHVYTMLATNARCLRQASLLSNNQIDL